MVAFNSTKQRAALRESLRSRGYHHEMLKDQPGRYVDMYWHRPILNQSGNEDKPVGTIMRHQSTLKDTQDRLNVRGLTQAQVDQGYLTLLPWPPSVSCNCRTCKDTFQPVGEIPIVEETPTVEGIHCDFPDCGYVPEGTEGQKTFRLTNHRRKHAKSAVMV